MLHCKEGCAKLSHTQRCVSLKTHYINESSEASGTGEADVSCEAQ